MADGQGVLEREHNRQWALKEDVVSKWHRDFENEQRSRWGRWKGAAPEGDPLHHEAHHWIPHETAAISSPTSAGGLGLPAEPILLEAGVIAVEHMCVMVGGPAWRTSYDAASRLNDRLPRYGAAKAAWGRQLQRLLDAGVLPSAGRQPGDGSGEAPAPWCAPPLALGVEVEVDEAAVEGMLSDLDQQQLRTSRSVPRWRRAIECCFPGVTPAAAVEWAHGGRDRDGEAKGARIVTVTGNERSERISGGQKRWALRQSPLYDPTSRGDRNAFMVGLDGWAIGHEEKEQCLLDSMQFDQRGFAIDAKGLPIQGEAMGALPPAL